MKTNTLPQKFTSPLRISPITKPINTLTTEAPASKPVVPEFPELAQLVTEAERQAAAIAHARQKAEEAVRLAVRAPFGMD